MLSGKPKARPLTVADRRECRGSGVSAEDGHRRGPCPISPPQPGGGVLPRMDKKQTGPAAISRARLGEGADGDAVGLPHLQLAELDPAEKTRSRRRLKKAEKQSHRDPPKRSTKTRALTPLLRTGWVSSQLLLQPGAWSRFTLPRRLLPALTLLIGNPGHLPC